MQKESREITPEQVQALFEKQQEAASHEDSCSAQPMGMAMRPKTGRELLADHAARIRRGADCIDRLLGALPVELNRHADEALKDLIRASIR